MNMRTGYRLLPWLLLACSNHPDSALFSGGVPDGTSGGTKAVHTGGTEADVPAAGGAGISRAGSTTGGAGARGGTAPVAGTSNEAGSPEVPSPDPDGGSGGEAGTNPDPPMCGNGKLEGGEECDDAKHEGEDGCNAECQVVCSDFAEDAEASADHHCYAGYDEAAFEDAQAACTELGAHLVTIGSAAENELVRKLVQSSKFIGAFENVELTSDAEGDYEWVTGEALTYENWDSAQPDRAGERCDQYSNTPRCFEHCAFMQWDGTWADQRCDVSDGYVCEWEPASAQK